MVPSARSGRIYMPLWSNYIFSILILLGIVYGWYLMWAVPFEREEQALLQRLHELVKKKKEFDTATRHVCELQSSCDRLSGNLRKKIQTKGVLSAQHLFKKILSDSSKADVILTYCSPLPTRNKEWYKKEQMKFTAGGNFFECVDLLTKIDNYDCYSKIPALTLEKKNDILKMECVVQTYSFE